MRADEQKPNGVLKTLIDNRTDNLVLDAVRRLMATAKRVDIATGFFEIGALLDLDGAWQPLEGLRLLAGGDISRQTRAEMARALRDRRLNGIEARQEMDDWKALDGLAAIRAALASGHIRARIYTRAKFHAKAYRFVTGGVVDHGLIGSSNLTRPGLTQNLELNLFTSDTAQLRELGEWYQQAWNEAEDITEEMLAAIEPHVREYLPFELYVQSMREYFLAHETDQSGWEVNESKLYTTVLAKYQRDAYHDLMHMAAAHGGGLLCDGVGLGKTFVALMLIERARMEKHKVLIVAPKAAIPSVWARWLDKYFPDDFGKFTDDIRVIAHTDLGRPGGVTDADVEKLRQRYDTVIVDEAHHFRTPYRNRSLKLKRLVKGKRLFLLTATPINNSVMDLYQMLNYYAQDNQRYFQSYGVPHLRNRFKDVEERLADDEFPFDLVERGEGLEFLKHVLVQRSRKYVKSLETQEDASVKFPQREKPEVIEYSLSKVYGKLLPEIDNAFDRDHGTLKLVIYETERFKEQDQDPSLLQDQSNVTGLIRTMLLKRLESSQKAFEASVEDLLLKHVVVLKELLPDAYQEWRERHMQIAQTLERHRAERMDIRTEDDEEEDDLPLTSYEEKKLQGLLKDVQEFGANEARWYEQLISDAEVLTDILGGLYATVRVENDDKLAALVKKIRATPRLHKDKVVIFTEFKDTARYLETHLRNAFPNDSIVEVDSGRNVANREGIIARFAPYYNCDNEKDLEAALADPIRVLISTDVLSEGLNLQDCNIIVNYDLHWNPVRLMQRIGRVDRRMDPSKPVDYDKVYVYNFLPPDELRRLLHLYERVTGKLIAINRTLGIEAPVLTAEDDFKAMDFYQNLGDFTMSKEEQLRLVAHQLEQKYPEVWNQSVSYPNRIYSGKPRGGSKLFLAYRIPTGTEPGPDGESPVFDVRWFLVDRETGQVEEDIEAIHQAIACAQGTPREVKMPGAERDRLRKLVESEVLARLRFEAQTPQTLKDELICWMEV
ncbi:MAG: DEAD/DEAH box helicase family protein [Fimbriimonadia bacterium]|jgi:superfamily II DNA or RNA helicase